MTSESTDGVKRSFRHPFLQACGMFVGEMMCMVAFYLVKCYKSRKTRRNGEQLRNDSGIEVERNEEQEEQVDESQPLPYNPLIFWPPALCDMTATSIQYIGLTLTYASSFQMLRGK
jgi:hypothetical protein